MKTVTVVETYNIRSEAVSRADKEWQNGRRCGVESVIVWNRMYPERPVKTTDRWLVFEEQE